MSGLEDEQRFERERYEFEVEVYKQANEYSRSMYEQFFKLAAMSFALNTMLLVALGFVMGEEVAQDRRALSTIGAEILAFLGVIYNTGALCAYNRSMGIWEQLHENMFEFEQRQSQRLGADLPLHSIFGDMTSHKSDSSLLTTYRLTRVFFAMLIIFWLLTLFLVPLSAG